jgi:nitrogen-specific signal transduction histidine kinase
MGAGSGSTWLGDKALLLVCDAAGRVQAVNSGAGIEVVSGINAGDTGVAGYFGQDSPINRWFLERIQEASERADFSAEADLDMEDGDRHVFVRLDSLKCENELYRFALQLCPDQTRPTTRELPELLQSPQLPKLEEGDSIVTRKQWHEIKNHVGALRLYATFLKRRMPEGDERQIVEKVLQGINTLIGYLDRIRRGEA